MKGCVQRIDLFLHLFLPKPTYLMSAGYGGKSKTNGENHPDGAIINFYLKEVDTVNSVYSLRFLDQDEKELVSYSSQSKNKEYHWVPEKGAGRFIWDMRTTGVEKVQGMILWWAFQGGPSVVPGNYLVQLIVNNDSLTVPLEILIDPRVTASHDDLQAQYDFLTDIKTIMGRINTTILEIRKVRNKLNDLKKLTNDTVLTTAIDLLIKQGTVIEETLYQTKNRSPQDPLNFPIRLNNKYGHVGSLANVGFNQPTTQMYEVKEELEGKIFEQFDDWENVKEEINTLNTTLHEAEVPYIEID